MVNIALTLDGCREGTVLVMASKSPVRRITAALDDLDVADSAVSRLDAARRLREAADELEAVEVQTARESGATWREIAACYGLTKQGAQQRFGAAVGNAKPAAPEAKRKKPIR